MMRCLREINTDNNTIGWYQSTIFGSYQTLEMIETFHNYAESIKRCVCIVFDPMQSGQGGLSLKAIKLKDKFMGVLKTGEAALTTYRPAFLPLLLEGREGEERRASFLLLLNVCLLFFSSLLSPSCTFLPPFPQCSPSCSFLPSLPSMFHLFLYLPFDQYSAFCSFLPLFPQCSTFSCTLHPPPSSPALCP